ncbi:putative phosphotransferase LicD4 [Planoprotostelium fungivorum]|uniref:Putative phosphotransferase LicD4 n=1 Tax=Planoprotostelium fungivorum TaxID=1890364 RepID=A0A2P6NZR1_9EUKA|nr:putative phosphotransferase LicD4 [Planoprotostelium fungivorum]
MVFILAIYCCVSSQEVQSPEVVEIETIEEAGANANAAPDITEFRPQSVRKGFPEHLLEVNRWRQKAFLKESLPQFQSTSVNHLLYIYARGENKTLEEVNYLDKDERKRTILNLLDILVTFFERHNLTFWLTHGSLLGSYRHKGYIPWDVDADLGITQDTYHQLRTIIAKNRKSKPINVFGHSDVQMLISAKPTAHYLPYKLVNTTNGAYADLFMFWPMKDGVWFKWPHPNSCESCKTHPRKWFEIQWEALLPFQKCEFEGRWFQCPKETKEYLVKLYDDLSPAVKQQKEFELEQEWAARMKQQKRIT